MGTRTNKGRTETGRTAWPRQFVKSFYFLLLFSLTMGLFCGEIPETCSLSDDVSNDCIEESSACHLKHTEVPAAPQVAERNISSLDELMSDFAAAPSVAVAEIAPASLLRLLSIQRK